METNYIDPVWKKNPSEIEWHFYIGTNTRLVWNTFDLIHKQALYIDAVQLGKNRMVEHYRHG